MAVNTTRFLTSDSYYCQFPFCPFPSSNLYSTAQFSAQHHFLRGIESTVHGTDSTVRVTFFSVVLFHGDTMVDAWRTAFRLWPGSSVQAAVKSKWLPHFVFSSPSSSVPSFSSSSSAKVRVPNGGKGNSSSPLLREGFSSTATTSNKKLYGLTAHGLQKLESTTRVGGKTSLQRFARAMMAYFGAGTAVVVTSHVFGTSTAHASERPNSTSWSASKHVMAVADARILWQRAVTNGILQQQEDVTRGHRLSYSHSPSPSPFSCQMLPLEMPLARANYRQGFFSVQDEVKKTAIQGNNRASAESRTMGTGSEFQWELSPSSVDQLSRNLSPPGNDAVISNLRKNDSCGSNRSEGGICRRGISVEDNESIQGEGEKLEGYNFSSVDVPSFGPSVQQRLTTKVTGSEWELIVSSSYMPENSSSGSLTSYSASGRGRERDRGFHPYGAGKSTDQWKGSGDNCCQNSSRLMGLQNEDLPQVFSVESGYQHQETVSGCDFSSKMAGLQDREEGVNDRNVSFHKKLGDSRRRQQSFDSNFNSLSGNTSGQKQTSQIEDDWEDQWELSLVPEESAVFMEKPGEGEILRFCEQMSRGEEDVKESWGSPETGSDSPSVKNCEVQHKLVSSSHLKPSESIPQKEKSQDFPEKCRFPKNISLENSTCEYFESVPRNFSETSVTVKEHLGESGKQASEYNVNDNVNKTFLCVENSTHSKSPTATIESVRRSSPHSRPPSLGDPCLNKRASGASFSLSGKEPGESNLLLQHPKKKENAVPLQSESTCRKKVSSTSTKTAIFESVQVGKNQFHSINEERGTCEEYGESPSFDSTSQFRQGYGNPNEPKSKPSTSYNNLTEDTDNMGPQKKSEKLNLNSIGEALCHSQTRARQAEEGILNEQAENKRLISHILRECAISYSCRQWALFLQAENMLSPHCCSICESVPCCLPKKGFMDTKTEPKLSKSGPRCRYCGTNHCCESSTLVENEQSWEIELACFGFLLGISFAGAVVCVGWKGGWITLTV